MSLSVSKKESRMGKMNLFMIFFFLMLFIFLLKPHFITYGCSICFGPKKLEVLVDNFELFPIILIHWLMSWIVSVADIPSWQFYSLLGWDLIIWFG